MPLDSGAGYIRISGETGGWGPGWQANRGSMQSCAEGAQARRMPAGAGCRPARDAAPPSVLQRSLRRGSCRCRARCWAPTPRPPTRAPPTAPASGRTTLGPSPAWRRTRPRGRAGRAGSGWRPSRTGWLPTWRRAAACAWWPPRCSTAARRGGWRCWSTPLALQPRGCPPRTSCCRSSACWWPSARGCLTRVRGCGWGPGPAGTGRTRAPCCLPRASVLQPLHHSQGMPAGALSPPLP